MNDTTVKSKSAVVNVLHCFTQLSPVTTGKDMSETQSDLSDQTCLYKKPKRKSDEVISYLPNMAQESHDCSKVVNIQHGSEDESFEQPLTASSSFKISSLESAPLKIVKSVSPHLKSPKIPFDQQDKDSKIALVNRFLQANKKYDVAEIKWPIITKFMRKVYKRDCFQHLTDTSKKKIIKTLENVVQRNQILKDQRFQPESRPSEETLNKKIANIISEKDKKSPTVNYGKIKELIPNVEDLNLDDKYDSIPDLAPHIKIVDRKKQSQIASRYKGGDVPPWRHVEFWEDGEKLNRKLIHHRKLFDSVKDYIMRELYIKTELERERPLGKFDMFTSSWIKSYPCDKEQSSQLEQEEKLIKSILKKFAKDDSWRQMVDYKDVEMIDQLLNSLGNTDNKNEKTKLKRRREVKRKNITPKDLSLNKINSKDLLKVISPNASFTSVSRIIPKPVSPTARKIATSQENSVSFLKSLNFHKIIGSKGEKYNTKKSRKKDKKDVESIIEMKNFCKKILKYKKRIKKMLDKNLNKNRYQLKVSDKFNAQIDDIPENFDDFIKLFSTVDIPKFLKTVYLMPESYTHASKRFQPKNLFNKHKTINNRPILKLKEKYNNELSMRLAKKIDRNNLIYISSNEFIIPFNKNLNFIDKYLLKKKTESKEYLENLKKELGAVFSVENADVDKEFCELCKRKSNVIENSKHIYINENYNSYDKEITNVKNPEQIQESKQQHFATNKYIDCRKNILNDLFNKVSTNISYIDENERNLLHTNLNTYLNKELKFSKTLNKLHSIVENELEKYKKCKNIIKKKTIRPNNDLKKYSNLIQSKTMFENIKKKLKRKYSYFRIICGKVSERFPLSKDIHPERCLNLIESNVYESCKHKKAKESYYINDICNDKLNGQELLKARNDLKTIFTKDESKEFLIKQKNLDVQQAILGVPGIKFDFEEIIDKEVNRINNELKKLKYDKQDDNKIDVKMKSISFTDDKKNGKDRKKNKSKYSEPQLEQLTDKVPLIFDRPIRREKIRKTDNRLLRKIIESEEILLKEDDRDKKKVIDKKRILSAIEAIDYQKEMLEEKKNMEKFSEGICKEIIPSSAADLVTTKSTLIPRKITEIQDKKIRRNQRRSSQTTKDIGKSRKTSLEGGIIKIVPSKGENSQKKILERMSDEDQLLKDDINWDDFMQEISWPETINSTMITTPTLPKRNDQPSLSSKKQTIPVKLRDKRHKVSHNKGITEPEAKTIKKMV